jgi:hypothetical protein
MSNDIKIGYWASEFEEDLPLPVADTAKPDQAEVIEKLRGLMNTGYLASYRGSSKCRLCGQFNGSKELEIIRGSTKYRIPEGYIHYLEIHNVGYDDRLLEVV